MQHNFPLVRRATMLEKVKALPDTKSWLGINDRDAEAGLRQHCPQMGGHVVSSFRGMSVPAVFFRNERFEKRGDIGAHRGIRIFLYGQRAGCMRTPERQ